MLRRAVPLFRSVASTGAILSPSVPAVMSCRGTPTTTCYAPAAGSLSALRQQPLSACAPLMTLRFRSISSMRPTRTLLARGAGTPRGSSGVESFAGVQSWQSTSSNSGSSNQSTADSLTPNVRQHLMRVYNLLALGVGLAAVGSAAMFMTPLGKMIPFWFPMIAGFVPLIWLAWRPPASVNGRLALFFAFTALEGMALAPIVKATLAKGVLGTSLVLTGAVFIGFSLAAYMAPRASMLALQGPLYGMLIGMVAISILNMFYPTAFAHSIILYGGLAIFSMMVATDTQAMIERARCGVSDHVQDALSMFLNVVNIFVRIAQIMRGMTE